MSDPITLLGYSDRLSAAAGESIAFKVSSMSASPFEASLVRVIHADANPAGPGMKFEPLDGVFRRQLPSRRQTLQTGSYARIVGAPWLCRSAGFTLQIRFKPTALEVGPQCLLSQRQIDQDGKAGTGLSIGVRSDGIWLHLYRPDGEVDRLQCAAALQDHWYDLTLSYAPDRQRVQIAVEYALQTQPTALKIRADFVLSADWLAVEANTSPQPADLFLAAEQQDGRRGCHFNGRIERPRLLACAVDLTNPTTGASLADGKQDSGTIYAEWDLSLGIDTRCITDTGPHGRHGTLHNLPTRAVPSSQWDGTEMCWRHAPRQYAAIHFHDDDLHDAQWETDFTFSVPTSLRSGAYAMRISVDGDVDYLPFYVRPALGKPTAKVLFIASTYTYQAYANFARGNYDASLKSKVAAWGAYPHNPDEHRDLGLSTYNLHTDGTGVYFSSRLRPMLTFRPGFMTFDDKRGSGVRHYIADSHLLDWMEHEGIDFDVVTDEDLHQDGAALLTPYACVLTGSHPEYHTAQTLDALTGYIRAGGNLAYLGGNGFYWRVGVNETIPGVLEMRRTETGTRAWAAPSGEYFHALDGQYGGLWRNSGRTPNQLVGIGFVSQGPYEGNAFRVLDDARRSSGGWILEGVEGPLIGDYGLCGGGAAGFELDAVEHCDGSPRDITVLARSEGHGPGFGPALDSLLSHTMSRARGAVDALIRAEMVHYHSGYGGQVFSVGSITFCGALSHCNYQNDIATLLRNVVAGFTNTSKTQEQALRADQQ